MAASTTDGIFVPLDKLVPDPDQPRKDFDPEGEHAWLVQSIRQYGLINPITVRPIDDGYLVVAGERRLLAAKEVGLDPVPVTVRDDDPAVARIVSVVENVVRADLTVIEEGDAYQALSESGEYSVEEIAQVVNRPTDRIRDRLALASLPLSARQAAGEGAPLPALRNLAAVCALDRPIGEALAWGAAQGAYPWSALEQPSRCLLALWRFDGTEEVECVACHGYGSVGPNGDPFKDEESFEMAEDVVTCEPCGGGGTVRVQAEDASTPPAFFAAQVSRYGSWQATVRPEMLAQLAQEAQDRIRVARQRAEAWHDGLADKDRMYVSQVPEPALVGEEVTAAALGIEGVAVKLDDMAYVVAPEFVAEWLPSIYESQVEEYMRVRRGTAQRPAKKPLGDMSPEERKQAEQEQEQRAQAKAEALEARQAARQFNGDLGVALATIGEGEPTTQAVKLLVALVLEHDRKRAWDGRSGEGHAMFQRYTRLDWETRKNGDPILPRSAVDRKQFAEEIDKRTDRELQQAKTPGQALAVLARYLGHGLADLSGLPNADLEGTIPYGEARPLRAWVAKLLPAGVRKRVPDSNGIPGRSQAW